LRNVLADEDQSRVHQRAHLEDEVGRRSIIDGNDDNAGEEAAPVRGDPFRAVFAPEDHLVALAESRGGESRCKPPGRPADLFVAVRPPPVAVVVDEKLAANLGEVAKEVDQRVPRHP
jgi:hypothetical protein